MKRIDFSKAVALPGWLHVQGVALFSLFTVFSMQFCSGDDQANQEEITLQFNTQKKVGSVSLKRYSVLKQVHRKNRSQIGTLPFTKSAAAMKWTVPVYSIRCIRQTSIGLVVKIDLYGQKRIRKRRRETLRARKKSNCSVLSLLYTLLLYNLCMHMVCFVY